MYEIFWIVFPCDTSPQYVLKTLVRHNDINILTELLLHFDKHACIIQSVNSKNPEF